MNLWVTAPQYNGETSVVRSMLLRLLELELPTAVPRLPAGLLPSNSEIRAVIASVISVALPAEKLID